MRLQTWVMFVWKKGLLVVPMFVLFCIGAPPHQVVLLNLKLRVGGNGRLRCSLLTEIGGAFVSNLCCASGCVVAVVAFRRLGKRGGPLYHRSARVGTGRG